MSYRIKTKGKLDLRIQIKAGQDQDMANACHIVPFIVAEVGCTFDSSVASGQNKEEKQLAARLKMPKGKK